MHANFAYSDLNVKTDKDLDDHINVLVRYCETGKELPDHIKFEEAMMLLPIAFAEKNSRAAIKQVEVSNTLAQETLNLTKETIRLWWATIGLTILGVVIAAWDHLIVLFWNAVGMFT